MTFWKWFGILVEYFSNHGKLCDCVVQMKAYNKNADITEEREHQLWKKRQGVFYG